MNKKYINFEEENNLSKYFKDVKKYKLITADDEVNLAIRIKDGDTKAIDELVKANLKFVVSIAKEYQNQGLSLSDLISEGNYGLVKAASRFDYTKGFKFISYAVWWVKQSIIQSLNDNARMIRLPTNVINKISTLKKEIEKFEFENEREPVFGEIFTEDNEPMELISYHKCISLNEVINTNGDELIDLIFSDESDSNKISEDKIKRELNKTLSTLNQRERDIIECYFGLNTDREPMTLDAIGERYSITKERIRQIKEKALRKLRFSAHNLYNLLNQY